MENAELGRKEEELLVESAEVGAAIVAEVGHNIQNRCRNERDDGSFGQEEPGMRGGKRRVPDNHADIPEEDDGTNQCHEHQIGQKNSGAVAADGEFEGDFGGKGEPAEKERQKSSQSQAADGGNEEGVIVRKDGGGWHLYCVRGVLEFPGASVGGGAVASLVDTVGGGVFFSPNSSNASW